MYFLGTNLKTTQAKVVQAPTSVTVCPAPETLTAHLDTATMNVMPSVEVKVVVIFYELIYLKVFIKLKIDKTYVHSL